MLKFLDAAKERASNSGTGPYNLSGAAFDASCVTIGSMGDQAESYFTAYDPVAAQRMVFKGTVTAGSPNTLSVDKVLNNGGSAVTFTNAPIIWCDIPAYITAMAAASSALTFSNGAL